MSIHGYQESEVGREFLEMQPGLILPVAAVPSLALLELYAYRGRRQRGQREDIQDFEWFLTSYEATGNDLRVHDELGEIVRLGGLDIEDSGHALLALDVARFHSVEAIELGLDL